MQLQILSETRGMYWWFYHNVCSIFSCVCVHDFHTKDCSDTYTLLVLIENFIMLVFWGGGGHFWKFSTVFWVIDKTEKNISWVQDYSFLPESRKQILRVVEILTKMGILKNFYYTILIISKNLFGIFSININRSTSKYLLSTYIII